MSYFTGFRILSNSSEGLYSHLVSGQDKKTGLSWLGAQPVVEDLYSMLKALVPSPVQQKGERRAQEKQVVVQSQVK